MKFFLGEKLRSSQLIVVPLNISIGKRERFGLYMIRSLSVGYQNVYRMFHFDLKL